MTFPATNIRDIRTRNRQDQVQASIVSHVEERLQMMESFTPAERAQRRRQWAYELVAAALSIQAGKQS